MVSVKTPRPEKTMRCRICERKLNKEERIAFEETMDNVCDYCFRHEKPRPKIRDTRIEKC